MLKKILFASTLLAASIATAQPYKDEYRTESAESCHRWASGSYMGMSVGPIINIAGSPVAYAGLNGTLSLGYGAFADQGYLAGEIFGSDSMNVHDWKNTTNGTNSVGVKSSWTYGFDLLPGFLVSNSVLGVPNSILFYLRAGAARTRFSDASSTKNGWRAGAGGQTALTQDVDIRSEYIYSRYPNISSIGAPVSGQFNVGLVYRFS